jgi:hypothetical protein
VVGRRERGREREVERVGDAVEMDEWLALGDLNAVGLEYVGGRGAGRVQRAGVPDGEEHFGKSARACG